MVLFDIQRFTSTIPLDFVRSSLQKARKFVVVEGSILQYFDEILNSVVEVLYLKMDFGNKFDNQTFCCQLRQCLNQITELYIHDFAEHVNNVYFNKFVAFLGYFQYWFDSSRSFTILHHWLIYLKALFHYLLILIVSFGFCSDYFGIIFHGQK